MKKFSYTTLNYPLIGDSVASNQRLLQALKINIFLKYLFFQVLKHLHQLTLRKNLLKTNF